MVSDIVRTKTALRAAIERLRHNRKQIALVPTMGALHAGHLSLVDVARDQADAVAASIFINPAQFGPDEDFSAYPRTEKEDVEKLGAAGVDVIYLPAAEEMYPEGFCTSVSVRENTDILCGAFRPGHFGGVATAVAKLFHQCRPDVAVFGEKDYQQLWVIRRMVRDLDLPVEVIGAPIVREADGLAMSSRNAYLPAAERAVAPALYRTLREARDALLDGGAASDILRESAEKLLVAGFRAVDYIELRDAETLAETKVFSPVRPARLLAATRLGRTRLIDNVAVPC